MNGLTAIVIVMGIFAAGWLLTVMGTAPKVGAGVTARAGW